MKTAAKVVSLASLVATILPPLLFFAGQVDLETTKRWMTIAAVGWFAATPVWMAR